MSAPAPVTSSAAAEKAAASAALDAEEESRWQPVLDLPCQLSVELSVPGFTVADFLKLRIGSVLETSARISHDVPLRINGTLIAKAEFDGGRTRLAVRVTELA